MMRKIIKEACVETIEEALAAKKNGADQIEFCSRLDLDGLTPDKQITCELLSIITIPVKVMIRPRPGHFIYSEAELNEMKNDILYFKALNIKGVVFGILTPENRLDLKQTSTLSVLALPLEVTIHKAIDNCIDPVSEIERLLPLKNVSSVLTSGKAQTAVEGKDMIREMISKAGHHIEIIAAGKITSSSFSDVHRLIDGTAYHGKRIVE